MLDLNSLHLGPRKYLRESRERLLDQQFEHFEIIPQTSCIGGEVRGLDLREELPPETVKELQRALVEFKVLFFRDQDIDVHQQAALAAHFGELETHPFLPGNAERPEVVHFAKDEQTIGTENVWHSDVSWREIPSLGSVLRAIEVPAVGGDTLWADMEAAYEGLSDEMKERLDGRTAIHDFAHSFGRMLSPEQLAERREEFPPAAHPVVRTHPESGRPGIYVNAIFTSHIVGLCEQESDDLLTELCQQAVVPEFQCRFRWAPGSIAFWDNRSTQHNAASDYWPERRVMERVTIIGDRPV